MWKYRCFLPLNTAKIMRKATNASEWLKNSLKKKGEVAHSELMISGVQSNKLSRPYYYTHAKDQSRAALAVRLGILKKKKKKKKKMKWPILSSWFRVSRATNCCVHIITHNTCHGSTSCPPWTSRHHRRPGN